MHAKNLLSLFRLVLTLDNICLTRHLLLASLAYVIVNSEMHLRKLTGRSLAVFRDVHVGVGKLVALL